jgi:hypothetical protein
MTNLNIVYIVLFVLNIICAYVHHKEENYKTSAFNCFAVGVLLIDVIRLLN